MRLRFIAPIAALAAATLATPRAAEACGGCFGPPSITQGGSAFVSGHRMALAVSPTRSVLWDQIQYGGAASEFAWVLPIGAGAYIEESTDAWFETLEAATEAQITSPTFTCPSVTTPGGCGLGSAGLANADFGGSTGAGGGSGSGPSVTITHQGSVGPYETVTLHSNQPNALVQWLQGHGYNIDADIEPIISAYVTEGFDFIALRLLPNKNVREMKPVRVVTPGASPALPLRMVAAGTGPHVTVTLYTLTEGRLAAHGYDNVVVSPNDLVWDFAAQTSNFSTVRASLLAKNAGFTWITAYAQQDALLSPVSDPTQGGGFGSGYVNFGYDQNYAPIDTIAGAYANQSFTNGETTDTTCTTAFDAASGSSSLVVDPCPAGVAPDDPSCSPVPAGDIDARTLACGKADDLEAALIGMHPADVWITRLEANLPHLALASDLTLEPADDQSPVSNFILAAKSKNTDGLCASSVPPVAFIPPGLKSGGDRGDGSYRAIVGYGILGLLAASLIGRRARRPRVVPARAR